MPRRRMAHTLKRTCLNFVVQTINSVWCADFIAEDCFPTYVTSPFSYFPPELTNEVLEALKSAKKLQWHHLLILIPPNLQYLDLSNSRQEKLTTNLPLLIQERTSKLYHVNLSSCHTNASTLKRLVEVLPNVQILNLPNTECTDIVLSTIGGHCKELRELDISWCMNISDVGVMGLCINMDDIETKKMRNLKLVKFCVMGTKVTVEGAICAITNLPQLKHFDFRHLNVALENLHLSDFEKGVLEELPKYPLCTYNANCDAQNTLNAISLQIAVKLCPNINSLCLANINILDSELVTVACLENLHELQISNGLKSSITFDGSILFILENLGRRLHSLSLSKLHSVNLGLIATYCPNLVTLQLAYIKEYESISDGVNNRMFKGLKNLTLVCIEAFPIPRTELRLLLSHSYDITIIFLQRCPAFTDELLHEIINTNLFKNLERLEMEYCNSVTAACVMTLLHLDNNLNSLKLSACQGIEKRDFEQIKDIAHNENLDIVVEWSNLT